MTPPTQDHLKTLEQSRQRLIQLTHSLGSLITSLNQSDPLPSWPSLQTQSNIISSNLQTLTSHLTENASLFNTLIAYPDASFPTKTHANTLEQLLRTKLDPRVDDWVSRGREAGRKAVEESSTGGASAGGAGTGAGTGMLKEHELAELWEWAPVEANAEARKRDWGGDFTLEEMEQDGGVKNVVTGLRRVLDVGDEEEEEEEEEEKGDEQAQGQGIPAMPLADVLRFMTTGVLTR